MAVNIGSPLMAGNKLLPLHKWLIEGEFVGDFDSGPTVPAPESRDHTIRCYENVAHYKSEPYYTESIFWETADKALLTEFLGKYGLKLDWYGYKKMEKDQ